MVVEKKRSASVALLGFSSDDEPEEQAPVISSLGDTSVLYDPPRRGLPVVDTIRNPEAPVEVEIIDMSETGGRESSGNLSPDASEEDGDDTFDNDDDTDQLNGDEEEEGEVEDVDTEIRNTDSADVNFDASSRKFGAGQSGNLGSVNGLKGNSSAKHTRTKSSDVVIITDDDDEGEIDESYNVQVDSDETPDPSVALAISAGGKDVEQRNARYFMMDNVVCSHCGVKGHMSFDCPEEADERRCFLCGKPGHDSKFCPDDPCFYCGKTGHRQRECPFKQMDRTRGGSGPRPRHIRFGRSFRRVSPPRYTRLFCHVCGADGHVDCSLVRKSTASLSCCNCGQLGHASNGCPEPPAERWVAYMNDLQREKRGTPGRGDSTQGNGQRKVPRIDLGQSAGANKEEKDPAAEAIRFKGEMARAVRLSSTHAFAATGRKWRENAGVLRR